MPSSLGSDPANTEKMALSFTATQRAGRPDDLLPPRRPNAFRTTNCQLTTQCGTVNEHCRDQYRGEPSAITAGNRHASTSSPRYW